MRLLPSLALLLTSGIVGCGLPLLTPRPVAVRPLPVRSVLPEQIQSISQVHTQCFGTCPAFAVTLHRDGAATYFGEAHVEILGHYTGTVDPMTFERLAKHLVREGFFRLAPYYEQPVTDQESTITTAVLEGDSVVVTRYGDAGPAELREIEDAIDSVSARIRWTSRP